MVIERFRLSAVAATGKNPKLFWIRVSNRGFGLELLGLSFGSGLLKLCIGHAELLFGPDAMQIDYGPSLFEVLSIE